MLIKIFACGIPIILAIALVTVIIGVVSRIIARNQMLRMLYSKIVTIIFVYCFSFFGAIYHAIIDFYSGTRIPSWLLWVLCIISANTYYQETKKQAIHETIKIQYPFLSKELFMNGRDAYMQEIVVTSLSMSMFIPISFVVFIFLGSFYNDMYFGLPRFLVGLF